MDMILSDSLFSFVLDFKGVLKVTNYFQYYRTICDKLNSIEIMASASKIDRSLEPVSNNVSLVL